MEIMKKVLVVDDEEAIRFTVEAMLEGYECVHASNGREALGRLDEHKDIGLIVCDYSMPEMNGYRFLMEVKQEERFTDYRNTPIIMIGTFSDEQRNEITRMGRAESMKKPLEFDAFLSAASKYLGTPDNVQ